MIRGMMLNLKPLKAVFGFMNSDNCLQFFHRFDIFYFESVLHMKIQKKMDDCVIDLCDMLSMHIECNLVHQFEGVKAFTITWNCNQLLNLILHPCLFL